MKIHCFCQLEFTMIKMCYPSYLQNLNRNNITWNINSNMHAHETRVNEIERAINGKRGNSYQCLEINAFKFPPPAGASGPEREEKVEMEQEKEGEKESGSELVANGAWSAEIMSLSSSAILLWKHELKASQFLSFHMLAASLHFNRVQWGPKKRREGGRGRQKQKNLAHWFGTDT